MYSIVRSSIIFTTTITIYIIVFLVFHPISILQKALSLHSESFKGLDVLKHQNSSGDTL